MPLEQKNLEHFALYNNTFLSEIKFCEKYGASPDAQGNEQLVYVQPDGKYVIKVNDCAYHGTWLEFFDRLALHNFLFPETFYELYFARDEFVNRRGMFFHA